MHSESRQHPLLPQGGLYAITGGPRPDFVSAVEAALRGGAALLQYRDKNHDHVRRREEARALIEVCARYAVPLIINDDVDLAERVGAAGVHLGERDAEIRQARTRLGSDAIIGVSCYASLDRAQRLAAMGADYLAFGAFYPSATKPDAKPATPELLRAARSLGLPLVAIGGITPDNAPPLLVAGANFIAAVSGVFDTPNIMASARRYAALFIK